MEKDDEVKGNGNSYTTEFRQYDPRIGRWLSIDALANKFPFYTPYQFAGNKPTVAVDLDGLEDVIFHNFEQKDGSIISGGTFYDIDEKTNKYLSKHMKVDLPPTGAVTTVKRQNGTFEILNASPSFELVAEKPAPKPLSMLAKIEKGMQGSSDNSYYEGSTGFYDHGGGLMALNAATLPFSVIATAISGGDPLWLGIAGIVNSLDDFTSEGTPTVIEEIIPGGGVLKIGISAANLANSAGQLIKGAAGAASGAEKFSKLGFEGDLTNTLLDEVQTIQAVDKAVEEK